MPEQLAATWATGLAVLMPDLGESLPVNRGQRPAPNSIPEQKGSLAPCLTLKLSQNNRQHLPGDLSPPKNPRETMAANPLFVTKCTCPCHPDMPPPKKLVRSKKNQNQKPSIKPRTQTLKHYGRSRSDPDSSTQWLPIYDLSLESVDIRKSPFSGQRSDAEQLV